MYRTICITLCFLGAIFAACSSSTPTAAQEVDFASVCADDNKGQQVGVQGYLRLPESFTGDQSVVLRLYETADLTGTPIGVQIRFGSEANQVEMVPLEYSDEDLKIHLADGQIAEFGSPVKVSGKVYFPAVDQDFDCGLENPFVEATNS